MRRPIENSAVEEGIKNLRDGIYARLKKHGPGVFVSNHETFGVLAEEYHETVVALQSNNDEKFRSELMDVAVAAIFGVMCLDSEKKLKEKKNG